MMDLPKEDLRKILALLSEPRSKKPRPAKVLGVGGFRLSRNWKGYTKIGDKEFTPREGHELAAEIRRALG